MYLAEAGLVEHTEHYSVSELAFVECVQSEEILMLRMPVSHGEHHHPLYDKLV